MASTRSETWVAAVTSALRRHGSWAGRVHLHKHLYLMKELGLADPPFDFVLYQYGPYSYELDNQIAQMELYGYLRKSFPQSGYGPQYALSKLGIHEADQLDDASKSAIDQVASKIGTASSQGLELQATCLWVERHEGIDDDVKVIERVKKIKPRYDEERIRQALDAVRRLATELKPPQSG